MFKALLLIYRGEFGQFAFGSVLKLPLLLGDIGLFGIALRTYRDVFTESHRKGAGSEPGHTGGQDRSAPRIGRGNAEDESSSGNDSVIGAKN